MKLFVKLQYIIVYCNVRFLSLSTFVQAFIVECGRSQNFQIFMLNEIINKESIPN